MPATTHQSSSISWSFSNLSCSSSEASESKALQLIIANSKLIRIKIFSPAPGYEIEIHELENVLALLEKFALRLGLTKSAARSLQLEFSENILAHELQLEPAGLCDEALCSVLNVDAVRLCYSAQKCVSGFQVNISSQDHDCLQHSASVHKPVVPPCHRE